MKVSLKKTARLLYIPPSPPHASHGPDDVGNLILYPWLLWGCRGLPGKPWQWSPGFGGHRLGLPHLLGGVQDGEAGRAACV